MNCTLGFIRLHSVALSFIQTLKFMLGLMVSNILLGLYSWVLEFHFLPASGIMSLTLLTNLHQVWLEMYHPSDFFSLAHLQIHFQMCSKAGISVTS